MKYGQLYQGWIYSDCDGRLVSTGGREMPVEIDGRRVFEPSGVMVTEGNGARLPNDADPYEVEDVILSCDWN